MSYWSFDAGWNDLHGTNHLTNHNGVTSVPGKLGNAGDFEASSAQYLSHADPDPLGDEDFTYALWFKRESIGWHHAYIKQGPQHSRGITEMQYHKRCDRCGVHVGSSWGWRCRRLSG